MRFPDQSDPRREDASGPDVTRGVLDRLGVPSGTAARPPVHRRVITQFSGRLKFVGILGMIVLGSILWRAFSASEDQIGLVENFPRTIEQGRESRTQVFMGFMAPFERVGQAINEVGGVGSGQDEPFDATGEVEDARIELEEAAPTSVDILEASAPFPNS